MQQFGNVFCPVPNGSCCGRLNLIVWIGFNLLVERSDDAELFERRRRLLDSHNSSGATLLDARGDCENEHPLIATCHCDHRNSRLSGEGGQRCGPADWAHATYLSKSDYVAWQQLFAAAFGDGGTSLAGFKLKKPTGFSKNPMYAVGITG